MVTGIMAFYWIDLTGFLPRNCLCSTLMNDDVENRITVIAKISSFGTCIIFRSWHLRHTGWVGVLVSNIGSCKDFGLKSTVSLECPNSYITAVQPVALLIVQSIQLVKINFSMVVWSGFEVPKELTIIFARGHYKRVTSTQPLPFWESGRVFIF